MKWHRRDHETEGDDNEHTAEQRGVRLEGSLGESECNLLQAGLPGCAKNPGDAINKKAGGERAKYEVLHASFEGSGIAPGKADQHIKRNANELERNKDHDKIDRRGHPHQAGANKNGEGKEFAEPGLRCRSLNRSTQ